MRALALFTSRVWVSFCNFYWKKELGAWLISLASSRSLLGLLKQSIFEDTELSYSLLFSRLLFLDYSVLLSRRTLKFLM